MSIANLYPSMTFVAYQLVQLYQKFLNTAFLTDMVGFSSPVITSSDLRRSPAVRMLYTLRSVVDYYVNNGSTVNICSLDISKAFDKMNHHCRVFLKLMQKHAPEINLHT